TWTMNATDGKRRDVALYFDVSAELTVNEPKQDVEWPDVMKPRSERSGKQILVPELFTIAIGSVEQPLLDKRGDDLRIDWGFLCVSSPEKMVSPPSDIDKRATFQGLFVANPAQSNWMGLRPPAPAEQACASIFFNPEKVSAQGISNWLMLAYDDVY